MQVTSRNNEQIKYMRRLAGRRFREREGKFILEGVRLLEEALAAGWMVETLVHTAGAASGAGRTLTDTVRERGGRVLEVTDELFRTLADTVSPQGVLAVARRTAYTLDGLLAGRPSLLLLADGVQDPGNLGAIIRSADAAGADGVILLPGTVDAFAPKTVRATMGSLFHLPVIMDGADKVLTALAGAGLPVVAGVPRAPSFIDQIDLSGPVVLAVGNEAGGISPAVLAKSEQASIPMSGRAESLNVAMAASIMLYEAVRQRRAFPIFQ
ncbi:hypothetical protein A6M21_01235 [Desulfotomaculum copahuensis]|uniref:RNA 2-O ribose methyltransferase substrate binding domain-containing protein n=2 Tax=Desulfotomaculum copahuensis TaxID=1838280 RepID=A0A1B7LAV8_9FIRM|nr:RNA methyltransferase [Desulfotomaculum copahuensis]OAT79453.1 hypothetical protein A6M21_01235 [Desulfotomaculum copahuensis]